MNKLVSCTRHHQVLTFFILVYAIAWPAMFLIYFVFPGNDGVAILSMPFMLFSPALSAMLIAGIAEPRPKHRPQAALDRFHPGLARFGTHNDPAHQDKSGDRIGPVFIIFGIMAVFPAWILSSAYARTPGIRRLFLTLLKPRGPAIWYLVIFLIFPGSILLSFYITPLLGGKSQFFLAGMGGERGRAVLVP